MPKVILSIDDDPIQHEIVEAALSALGDIEMLKASNGVEALELIAARRGAIALIVCDLHMPDFDDIELVNELVARQCRTPLIFVSGAAKPVLKAAGLLADIGQLTVAGSLAKPVQPLMLLALARNALSSTTSSPFQISA